jgi:hypothetical protein
MVEMELQIRAVVAAVLGPLQQQKADLAALA